MRLGVADPLVELLSSKNVEVQCNTCGCITAVATTGKQKTTGNNKATTSKQKTCKLQR